LCSTKLGRIKIILIEATKKSNTVHPSRKFATLTMEPRFCVFDMSQSRKWDFTAYNQGYILSGSMY
jgi:hypothetical protein